MKKMLSLLVLCSLVLPGCTHQYVMKLSNGSKITTASKPKLVKGFYVYKDAKGEEVSVSQARVLEVEPASMAKEEETRFKPLKMK